MDLRENMTSGVVLWLALSMAPAWAGLPDLLPLTAQYRTTVNGIPAGTPATVNLRSLGGTRHETSFRIQNRFMTHQEWSRFDWQNCSITAREYAHEFHGLGIDRQSALTFDWERRIAIEARGEKSKELPLTDDIVDGLNMAMLARCRLRDGARSLNFPVLYRGERKNMQFEVIGEEKINTRLGIFDAWIVERRYPQRGKRTRVWVAPALDWFMVRFEHVENPVVRGSLLLTAFTLNGNALPVVPEPTEKAKEKPKRTAKKLSPTPITTAPITTAGNRTP